MLTKKIKKYYLNLLFSFLEKSKFKPKHANISYSQEGEDMILRRIFENKKNGFYVDIGAHHPKRFSNTFYFYQLGWCGINIDAMPGSMEIFRKIRPRDINLEIAIGTDCKKKTYYMFNESALNTFSTEIAKDIEKVGKYKLVGEKKIDFFSLSSIIDKHLPHNFSINFFTIDAEGIDINIIQSNDWNKYHPEIVLIEERGCHGINEVLDGEVNKFMVSLRYQIIAKTFNTVFYSRQEI